jgi:hypothetical protein
LYTERAIGRDGGGGRNRLFLFKMPFPLRLLAMITPKLESVNKLQLISSILTCIKIHPVVVQSFHAYRQKDRLIIGLAQGCSCA